MNTLDLHAIPYLFPVQPGRRESIESFTRRIQARNYETAQHRADLIRAVTADKPDISPAEAWHYTLEVRTGRTLHLQMEAGGTPHADGTYCTDCATRIGARYLCRLCAHGVTIKQPPHTDDFVCLRHHMYVGPGTTRRTQSAATEEDIAAELLARKLRRKGRLDAALYTTLLDVFAAASPRATSVELKHRRAFPALVELAAVITSTHFRNRFFDPAASYAASFKYLTEVVAQLAPVNPIQLRNNLWFRYRPVFLSIRESLQEGTDYTPNSDHELPGPKNLDTDATRPTDLEPFTNYLSMSLGLRIDDLNWPAILTPSTRVMPSWTQSVGTICLDGHRTVRTIQSIHKNAKLRKDACGICHNRILLRGKNDMPTTHPKVAVSFHPTKNRKAAADYFAGSAEKVWWLCQQGHEWQATCSNRTSAGSGCPLCSYRLIIPGQNDLATAFPEVAARWHPDNPQDLATISPRSTATVKWRCNAGHEYRQAVSDAVDHGTCTVCDREVATDANALTARRPDVVAQLHPTRNAGIDITAIAVTSTTELWWVCGNGHPFVSRVDHRVAGIACTVCFPRRLHRGVNDAQTRYPELCREWHPYLNSKSPDRVIPGNDLHWWKCLAAGHNLQQSVPHRVASRGCPDCVEADRVLSKLEVGRASAC